MNLRSFLQDLVCAKHISWELQRTHANITDKDVSIGTVIFFKIPENTVIKKLG